MFSKSLNLFVLGSAIAVSSVINMTAPVLAQTQVRKMNATLVANLIKDSLKGTQLHLHNLGSKSGSSYHKSNSSYIQFGKSLGGNKQIFTIPETKVDAGSYGWLRYYVNDVNLSSFDIKQDGNRFKVTLLFESNGTELKGYHTAKLVDLGDKGAPDVEMDNMRLDVYLTPGNDAQGRLTYNQVEVNFDANIQAGGICKFKTINFCGNSYKRQIAVGIENAVRAQLDNPTTRNQLAAAFSPVMKALNIGKITKVYIQGSTMFVEYQ